MMSLRTLYESLQNTSRKGVIALPTSSGSPHRIAKSVEGHVMVLFAVIPASSRSPPMGLANLRLDFNRTARLIGESGEVENDSFAMVECLSDNQNVVDCFLDIMETLLQKFPTRIEANELRSEFDILFETFRRLTQAPSQTALGLWGELFLIAESSDPLRLIEAWHRESTQLVDFATEDEWIEVKTCAGEERRHVVSQRQVSPPKDINGHLVSVMTLPVSNGTTLRKLMLRIEQRLEDQPTAIFNMHTTAMDQLGRDHASALGMAFDEAVARTSLRIYPMAELPHIPGPLPSEISGVRYIVDLTALPGMKEATFGPLIGYINT